MTNHSKEDFCQVIISHQLFIMSPSPTALRATLRLRLRFRRVSSPSSYRFQNRFDEKKENNFMKSNLQSKYLIEGQWHALASIRIICGQ